jgi:hypothetical protein
MLGCIGQNLPMQPWITEVTQGFVIGDILKSIKGLIRCGGELQTTHTTITFIEGGFLRPKNKLTPKFGHHTIVVGHGRHLWNYFFLNQYSKVVGTIELNDFN